MVVDHAQRWRDRYGQWVCTASAFDKRWYSTDVVKDGIAKRFIEQHHYSGSLPATRLNIGLFGNAGLRSELVGICSFTVPMNQNAIPKRLGVEPNAGAELGRLVLLDSVGFNGESWLVAKAFNMLKREKPSIRGIVSYADPIERRDGKGEIVKRGHLGGVYQALGARLQHSSAKRKLVLLPNGTIASERGLAKIRTRDQGWEYAERQLIRSGLQPRHAGEQGLDYLRRVMLPLQRIIHPGNYAYAWGFDAAVKAFIGPANPADYPKLIRLRHEPGLPDS